jgi:uncharacterized membrane protein YphA (DoxX/SURF4 family)
MLAGIFVASGARNLAHPEVFLDKASRVTGRVGPQLKKIHPRLPSDDRTLMHVNSVVQIVGGILLVTRARRVAAVVLAGTLVPTTIAAHPFWHDDDPAERRRQNTQFLKNLSIFGGLMLAAVDNEGKPGLRWRTNRLVTDTNRSVRRGVTGTNRSVRRSVQDTRDKAKVAVKATNVGRRLPG